MLSQQPIKVQKEILEIDLKEKTKELKQSEQEKKMIQKFLLDRTSALKSKQQEIDKLYNEIEELHALYNEKKRIRGNMQGVNSSPKKQLYFLINQ